MELKHLSKTCSNRIVSSHLQADKHSEGVRLKCPGKSSFKRDRSADGGTQSRDLYDDWSKLVGLYGSRSLLRSTMSSVLRTEISTKYDAFVLMFEG